MNFIDNLQAVLIRICVHPFKEERAISFREQFVHARRIGILARTENASEIQSIIKTLQGKECVLILSNGNTPPDSNPGVKQINLQLNRLNVWTFSRSEFLKNLVKDSFDIFIDLNDSPHLLGVFLSRKLGAPVRICMTSPHPAAAFNLIYNHSETASYTDRLKGFSGFLQQFAVSPKNS